MSAADTKTAPTGQGVRISVGSNVPFLAAKCAQRGKCSFRGLSYKLGNSEYIENQQP